MTVRNAERAGRAPDQRELEELERPDERRSGKVGDSSAENISILQTSGRVFVVAENGTLRLVFDDEISG